MRDNVGEKCRKRWCEKCGRKTVQIATTLGTADWSVWQCENCGVTTMRTSGSPTTPKTH